MVAKVFRCLFMVAAVALAGLGACVDSQEEVPDRMAETAPPAADSTDVTPPPHKALKAGTTDDESAATIGGDVCCNQGYYLCPGTGESFDYDPLASGGEVIKKTTAAQRCASACDEACVDAGP